MSWTTFIVGVVLLFILIGIVIPFAAIFAYSGIMRTKINYLKTLADKEEEKGESKKQKPSHVHSKSSTNKQQ